MLIVTADLLPAWDTYGQYLDAIDADPPSLNVAVLIGHGTVRLDAMRNERRVPNDAELARMLDTLEAGLDVGCVGFSTGLIYEPGRYSNTDELVCARGRWRGSVASTRVTCAMRPRDWSAP